MTASDALRFVAARAAEYARMAKLTRAGKYPLDNTCARCGQVSDRPLVPWSVGWLCHHCTFGADGALATVVAAPAGASCCETGESLRLKCALCKNSPTFWRSTS